MDALESLGHACGRPAATAQPSFTKPQCFEDRRRERLGRLADRPDSARLSPKPAGRALLGRMRPAAADRCVFSPRVCVEPRDRSVCQSPRPEYIRSSSNLLNRVVLGQAAELDPVTRGGNFMPTNLQSKSRCPEEVLGKSEKTVRADCTAGSGPTAPPMQRKLPQSVTTDPGDMGRPRQTENVATKRSVTFSDCQMGSLDVEKLLLDEPRIDPCRPSLKHQLIERLCVGSSAAIERVSGHGGLNMGIWLLRDVSQTFVIKMVTCTRFMGMPNEAEVFTDLSRRHPQIMNDQSLAFPIKIFECVANDGSRRHLIVMRKAAGECFADIISRKFDDDRSHADLMQDFEAFGTFLAGFHSRHGLQHGDCQPANVMYDEASRSFSLIDLADLGSSRIKRTDVEHFGKGILSFAKRHGQTLCEAAQRHFEAAYARC